MQITIVLGDEYTESDGGSIEAMIIDRAATKVANEIDREMRQKLDRQIAAVSEDELREMMRPLLAEAMTQLLQPTDTFGTPKGEPKTLQQVIVEIAEKELRKPTDRYDSKSPSVLQKLIREEVQHTIRAELQAAMKDARDEVLQAVQAEGAKVVTDTIARIARV